MYSPDLVLQNEASCWNVGGEGVLLKVFRKKWVSCLA